MEEPILDCQTCFRPHAPAGAQSQWKSFCKCERAYTPGSQFSIDVCANCKMRVGSTSGKVRCRGLCSCATPDARKVATYIKQNEKDSVTFDTASIGLSPDSFPAERYVPIGILGDSARATTLLARDKQRGTKVALKCFKQIAPSMKPTFESEVRKNKELNHTSIAKIVDFGFPNGKTPYLVTEYKEGFNLEQCLALHGIPSHDVAVKIMIGICESLLYAYKQGVLHRDVRAANVIFLDDMNSEPSIALLDFALPKIAMAEELTEPYDAFYLSADKARNLEYDERSESYSVGCIGYALLTGRAPFTEGSALEIKNLHALTLPPQISRLNFDNTRPKDLEEIIERCLEKDPRYRFESIAKLMERLEVFPRRDQMRMAQVLSARKKKKMLISAAAVLAAVAVCAGGYLMFAHH